MPCVPVYLRVLYARMPVYLVCLYTLYARMPVCPYFTPNQHDMSNFTVKTAAKIRCIPVKKLQDFPKLL